VVITSGNNCSETTNLVDSKRSTRMTAKTARQRMMQGMTSNENELSDR
jgi:hypothetical protein